MTVALLSSAGRTLDAAAPPAGGPFAVRGVVEPTGGYYSLAFARPGTVRVMRVGEGDAVTSGLVLAEIGSEEVRARLNGAKAESALAEGRLKQIEARRSGPELDAADADVKRAQGVLDAALVEFRRLEGLAAKGTATKADVERARTAWGVAEAEHRTTAAKAARLREQAGPDVDTARAELLIRRARVDELEAELQSCRIVAPVSGRVLFVGKRVGEAVAGAQHVVLVMADLTDLTVRCEVDEARAGEIRPGDPARVRAGEAAFTGRVVRIADMVGRAGPDVAVRRPDNPPAVVEVFVQFRGSDAVRLNQRVVVELAGRR